jgi:hypothetical protein
LANSRNAFRFGIEGVGMKRLLLVLTLLWPVGAGADTANERTDTPNRGALIWAAFRCSTYAELSGDRDEQRRLAELGYRVGKAFYRLPRKPSRPERGGFIADNAERSVMTRFGTS